MVKGISKRVVIVRPPDSKVFEEAIFIVRGDAARDGISAEEIVREACRTADSYMAVRGRRKKKKIHIPAPLFAAAGAAATVGIWFLTTLF